METRSNHAKKMRIIENSYLKFEEDMNPGMWEEEAWPALLCSLTSCRDLSGESPDDGRFPVRPSSLIPNVARRRTTLKAGVTMYLRRRGEEHVASSCCSQSGGLGKHVGRNIK